MGISEASTSDTLDPAVTGNLFAINLAHTCRNFLTEIAPDNTVAGELAESWEPNADGSEWHFKLRQGVEFHNGKTMDADDVIASLNHHRGENTVSAAKALLAAITDISSDSKDTVTIKLEAPNADFPAVLTDYHLNILPKDGDSIDWQSGVGTGAYILEDYQPGISASYRKNPNFFKEGKGNFDSVEMLALADVNARQTALGQTPGATLERALSVETFSIGTNNALADPAKRSFVVCAGKAGREPKVPLLRIA